MFPPPSLPQLTGAIESGANAVGMSIPPQVTTESGALKTKKLIFYFATRGLISRDIKNISQLKLISS